MPSEEIVAFEINKPDPAATSRYILFLTRTGGGGMFGSSSPSTMFAIDTLEEDAAGLLGFLDTEEEMHGAVVGFSKDHSYMLVDRRLVTPLTLVEMASKQEEQRKLWDTVEKPNLPAQIGGESPVELLTAIPGQYL